MDDIIPLRHCNKCTSDYPATLEHFYADKRTASGFRAPCKECIDASTALRKEHIRTYRKAYYTKNKDEIKQKASDWYETHKEEAKEYKKAYNIKNRERIKLRNQRYLHAHREERRQYHLKWRHRRKEHLQEYTKRYREQHRKAVNLRGSRWYHRHKNDESMALSRRRYETAHRIELRQYRSLHRKTHREQTNANTRNRRAQKRGNGGRHTASDIRKQHANQKGKCYYCKVKVGNNYHVDHVVPVSRGGSNGPENLVIACPACNIKKHDKLPHEFFEGGRLL